MPDTIKASAILDNFGKINRTINMSAEEDWYMVGRFEEEEWEREEILESAFHDKMDKLVKDQSPQQVNAICPMQLMSQMNETLSKASTLFGNVLNIKGIFKPDNGRLYNNGYYYDYLKDENNNTRVKILVPPTIRAQMKPDSLVIVRGMVTKRMDSTKSSVELQFRVDSLVEEVKAQAIDKEEQKRIELRQRKVTIGFKNVDSILEALLMNNTRPHIALVFAQNSITLGDFENGKRAAAVAIDFIEERITFTQTNQLCAKLKELDNKNYHAIALVRGGGIDSKTDVDKPEVIETIVNMKTPFISGVGHKEENIFLRQVADKWTPNPQGLGQYFHDLVESVTEKKNNSKAALMKQVEAQYKGQIEAQKQNAKTLEAQNKKLEKDLSDERREVANLRNQLMKKQDNTFGRVIGVIIALAAVAYVILKLLHII